jgi:Asp-tRNA(Asn)/Glu-tRNA(Gln) amidotransferase A subunit family amidase
MGIKLITESFDTLGVLGRTVPDVSLVARVLADSDAVDFDRSRDLRPRIGFCRSPYWDSVSAPLQQAMAGAASKLSAAGAVVVDLDLQPEFANLVQVHADIYGYEIFRALAYERTQRAELIAPEEALAIHAGGRVNRSVYECAQAAAANCRRMLDAHFDSVDVLISASATGEAPRDLKTTGRPIMGMMWTALHTPSISLPVFDGPAGMPMGLQVIGRRGNDAQALLCAEWIHQILT